MNLPAKAEERAKFLIEKFRSGLWKNGNPNHVNAHAKECALIAIEVVQASCLQMYNEIYKYGGMYFNETAWAKELDQIKQEIEKL